MKAILDHSIVGQSALTNFTFREDRPYAGCRICGEVFQPSFFRSATDMQMTHPVYHRDIFEAHEEIARWRVNHNKKHTSRQHLQLAESGMVFTPEASLKLAPFGLVAVGDAQDSEIAGALREAPRAPSSDGQH